jgi:hypothetical protein
MTTQKQIAEHLDISQPQVSGLMERMGIDWRTTSLDAIRIAYIGNLRAQASGHRAEDGTDLVRERVLTERVDRELKQLLVNEKKGVLVNVTQLESELMQMVGAFKSELLSRDDKLKDALDALYGINTDISILNEHTHAALSQLARYDASGQGTAAPLDGDDSAT